jgi:beta-N-acetylhexosaminidase
MIQRKVALYFSFTAIALCLSVFFLFNQKISVKVLDTELEERNNIEDPIQRIIESMTPEEKVGQLFLIGNFEDNSNAVLEKFIREKHIGSVILLNQNIGKNKVKEISDRLQAAASSTNQKVPLFISVDQEGGTVSRIKDSDSNLTAQSDIKSSPQAYQVAFERGNELKSKGVNLNFSPVLEYIQNKSSFLYSRTFRETKDDLISYGSSMVKGYQDAGILATVKHFPGHDDKSVDSHKNLPVSDVSESDFFEHTRVFREVINQSKPKMVMTAHVIFPKIDPDYPATLSSKIIGKLRNDFKYDGVIITDDMNMGAITKSFGVEKAALKAFEAGNDILLYVATASNINIAYNSILSAYQKGEIPGDRIDESVYRIIRLKQFLISSTSISSTSTPGLI